MPVDRAEVACAVGSAAHTLLSRPAPSPALQRFASFGEAITIGSVVASPLGALSGEGPQIVRHGLLTGSRWKLSPYGRICANAPSFG